MSWPKRVVWIILFLAVYLPWDYIENQSWLGVGIERFEKQSGDYRVFDSIGGSYVISNGVLYYVNFRDLYCVNANHKVSGRRLWVKGGQDGYEIPYMDLARSDEDFGGWKSDFSQNHTKVQFLDKNGNKIEFSPRETKPWR